MQTSLIPLFVRQKQDLLIMRLKVMQACALRIIIRKTKKKVTIYNKRGCTYT